MKGIVVCSGCRYSAKVKLIMDVYNGDIWRSSTGQRFQAIVQRCKRGEEEFMVQIINDSEVDCSDRINEIEYLTNKGW